MHGAVCKQCNDYFSGTTDLALSRQSVEGLERYRWGIKDPSEIKTFQFSQMTLRVRDEGDFSGAEVELYHNTSEDKVLARPVDGVSIHNSDDEGFTHFTLESIRSGEWTNSKVDWRKGIRIYGSESVTSQALAILAEQGVKPAKLRPLVPPVTESKLSKSTSSHR